MTPTLFPMPPRQETRLERLKREHRIWTHYSWAMPEEEGRWCALLLPPGVGPSNAVELIADRCRLLEDYKQLVTGTSEAEAVFRLCQFNNIPCVL